ncbi:MAG: Gfo/Idh/MocA family protein [Thermomicrobiales bacterium]
MSVHLGIIGAGQIARFHAAAIAAAGGCLVAVADADEMAGRRLAEQTRAAFFVDPRALLDDPRVQAVIIATPNATHYALALAALEADKDVFCEKPMTTSADDSARLVQAVRERPGAIFQVGYMKRFNPGFLLLRELLPQIGEPLSAEFRVLAESRPSPVDSWYRRPEDSGGGILTHSGSHLIDVMRFLLGEPARVDARVRFDSDVSGLDLATQALIELESGLTVHFAAISTPAPGLGHTGEGWEETIEVSGTGGRLRLSSPNWQATAPCLVTLQRSGERQARTFFPERGSPWEAEMHAFLHAVETRQPPSPDVVDGYRVDETLAALYRSGQERAPIDIHLRY